MTSYDVTLERTDGPTQTIAVNERETILEAAQRAGVRLPSDCRKGTCTTCVGRVVAVEAEPEPESEVETEPEAGAEVEAEAEAEPELETPSGDRSGHQPDAATAVDYRRPPRALEERERTDGYALLCIALPRADCRIEVGPRVRAEVGDSPWK
ncbi:2Fe-2S iron-sulfur cluster-binding protein [Natrialba sp. PRR66]|uniref:2Fe-2S iron-sulfur cluster-binding protein n=1 Tax=Natrialba sp. PRR66 TaxID=3098146 RepID=UPI002B1D6FC8|nr:2Fe-2S iron-sulfur cluster-binding protein [Natrialba sp. PRR66]